MKKSLGQIAFEWVHRESLNKNEFCKWENRSKEDQDQWQELAVVIVSHWEHEIKQHKYE